MARLVDARVPLLPLGYRAGLFFCKEHGDWRRAMVLMEDMRVADRRPSGAMYFVFSSSDIRTFPHPHNRPVRCTWKYSVSLIFAPATLNRLISCIVDIRTSFFPTTVEQHVALIIVSPLTTTVRYSILRGTDICTSPADRRLGRSTDIRACYSRLTTKLCC